MGRKTIFHIGDKFGQLQILEIIPQNKSGTHVKLKCFCLSCSSVKIMNGSSIRRRNSCGCLQRISSTWKDVGPKSKPWQLPTGEAARRNVEYLYKKGAEKRQLEYLLTENEFNDLIVGPCFYCGRKLTQCKKGQGKTSGDFWYTGIDRKISQLGYTKENCVSCCWDCNKMKNNKSFDEFISHLKLIVENQRGK